MLRAFAIALSAMLLTGCRPALLDPAGPVADAQRTILYNSLAIMLAIVVPTILATLGFAWHFRATNTKASHLPDWEYSGRIEAVVWSIPALVVLFLGGIAWTGSHDLDPAKPLAGREMPLKIQVVSLDWKWLFILPEQGIASVNALTVPAGRPLHFSLTSASVMNAFFVPQLGSMIYTMNGMTTQLHLQADKPGTYAGLSSHFSGDGFADMRFDVTAVEPAAFEAWTAKAKEGGEALDRIRYETLARQSKVDLPSVFRLDGASLFDDVVTQTIAPARGPEAGRPDPGTSARTGG